MNKEFIYFDKKYILLDDNGLNSPKDYYDNLEEVLKLENSKEELELKTQELNDKNASLNTNRSVIMPTLFPVISLATVRLLLPITLNYALNVNYDDITKVYVELINSNVNILDVALVSMGVVFIPICSLISICNLIINRINNKEINLNNEEISLIRSKLLSLEKNIKELKNDKTLSKNIKYNDNEIVSLLKDDVKKKVLVK